MDALAIAELPNPTAAPHPSRDARSYAPPAFEVVALDCEITAYAPDGGDPLF